MAFLLVGVGGCFAGCGFLVDVVPLVLLLTCSLRGEVLLLKTYLCFSVY